MKPIAYIDHVSGKPKLIDGYVVSTPYDIPLYTTPQTKEEQWYMVNKDGYVKPLSEDEIIGIYRSWLITGNDPLVFARAIEERHGIK